MFTVQDRMSKATQRQIESQLDAGARLADTAMHSMQQVADLNLNLARATLEQSNFAARQFLSAQDTEQVLSLAAAQVEPNLSRTLDYGYYLTTITADAQAGLIDMVGSRIADTNRQLNALADNIDQDAPSGFRAAMRLLGALLDGVDALYGEMARAAKKTAIARDDGRRCAQP